MTELAEDRVVSSRGRRTPRGVKRKMSKFHLRPRRHRRARVVQVRIHVRSPKCEALFKLGTRVVRSVRRLVLHLPRAYPHLAAWRLIACRLGAAAG